ncbi:MAG: DinB family protein [Acidimicrobiia bacterium]
MDRAALILRYAAGYEAVTDALAGITDDELDHRPSPAEWTARQIVHHLADSETNSYLRLRMLLATPGYVVQPYDQDGFAAHPLLGYDRPIAVSLAVLEAVRASSLDLLARLDDDDLRRSARHPEHDSPYTLALWLRIYADHPHDHADQIRAARHDHAAAQVRSGALRR